MVNAVKALVQAGILNAKITACAAEVFGEYRLVKFDLLDGHAYTVHLRESAELGTPSPLRQPTRAAMAEAIWKEIE